MKLSQDARAVLGAAARLRKAAIAWELAEQRALAARGGVASFNEWVRTHTGDNAEFVRASGLEGAAQAARDAEREAARTLIAIAKSAT